MVNVGRTLALALLLISTSHVSAGGFEVEKAWIREAPPGMKMMAGYMQLENEKSAALNLVGVTSPDFDSIEIHHTVIKDGMASMVHLKSVIIPAYSTVKFEPNGLHLMLIDPKRSLRVGDKVKIKLKFSNYRTLKIKVPVKKTRGSSHQNH